jgi:hypothetical protein
VPDLDTALRRVEEHCLPLEDARARVAYGYPSAVNRLLILNAEFLPGRGTVLLLREAIGFLGGLGRQDGHDDGGDEEHLADPAGARTWRSWLTRVAITTRSSTAWTGRYRRSLTTRRLTSSVRPVTCRMTPPSANGYLITSG